MKKHIIDRKSGGHAGIKPRGFPDAKPRLPVVWVDASRHGARQPWFERETMHSSIAAGVLATLCTISGGCIYANVNTPLSYRSPTPLDVGGQLGQEVEGESCNHLVLWLVAWGDAGYAAAIDKAQESSGAQLIADVKADSSLFNILGVYQRNCTRVRGRAVP